MTALTLVIGNKNYSSWSLRAWLALQQAGASFEEIVVPLDQPGSRDEIRRHSPGGKVPALRHGDLVLWESLAICEYVAELYPKAQLWPADRTARAIGRAVSNEMHAGFTELRKHMPMDCRSSRPGRGMTPSVQADIARITQLWQRCRQQFGAGGHFLFGAFTIADAMFAPVASRMRTYDVQLDPPAAAYVKAVLDLPAMRSWYAAAAAEPWTIEHVLV